METTTQKPSAQRGPQALVGSGRLVRHCYAVLHAEPDLYGHPRLDYFTNTIPDEDLPDGKRLVRARVEYVWNGNIRKWDIVPNNRSEPTAPRT